MTKKKRIKTKNFQEYIKTRFTEGELAEIEAEAEREVAELRKCQLDHTPNAVTMKSMENIEAGKGLEEVCNVEEFFKKLMAP